MTREDYIWVAIRIFGIYLIVLAVTGLPGLVMHGTLAYQLRDMAHQGGASQRMQPDTTGERTLDPAMQTSRITEDFMFRNSLASFVSPLVRVIMFSIGGIYFLRGGKLIFGLIYPERPQDNPRKKT